MFQVTLLHIPHLQKYILGSHLLPKVNTVLWLRAGVVRVVQLGSVGDLVRVPDGLRARSSPLRPRLRG